MCTPFTGNQHMSLRSLVQREGISFTPKNSKRDGLNIPENIFPIPEESHARIEYRVHETLQGFERAEKEFADDPKEDGGTFEQETRTHCQTRT
jgi:hypothetical protein